MKKNILFALSTLIITSCATHQDQITSVCTEGTTKVDGICVRQDIADYVGCVRAQGAQLESKQSHSLSATVGKLAVNASAASDVSTQLKKIYTASDKAMLAIIDACNMLAGNGKKYIKENSKLPPDDISTVTHPRIKSASVTTAKNFKFEVKQCTRQNDNMTCLINVTNLDKDRNLIVYPSTRVFNMEGREYNSSYLSLVDTSGFKMMLSGLPMTLKLDFDSITVGDKIPKLEIMASISRMKHHRFSAVLKNVAVSAE